MYKKFIALMLLLLLIGNRFISKISIGPIFYLDLFLLLGLLYKINITIKYSFKIWMIFILFLYGFIWLIIDFQGYGFDFLIVRRFSIVVYMFIPLLFFKYGNYIYKFMNVYALYIFICLFFLYVLKIENFHASLAAQLMSITLCIKIFIDFKRSNSGVFNLLALILLYFVVVFGMMGDGLFKTPLLGFILSILIIVLYKIFNVAFMGKRLNLYYVILLQVFIVILMFVLLSTGGQIMLAEAIYAIAGLIDSTYLRELASSISDAQVRARGNSFATASTRTMFWSSIINHGFSDPIIFCFGNGHGLSFLDRLFPGIAFIDTHLIEPHNSFVGIFYRYGVFGLIFLFGVMYQTRKFLSYGIVIDKNLFIASTIIGINYLSFEVVLESPHGAFLFWYIWLMPYFVGIKKTN